jgi:hypothetical protein
LFARDIELPNFLSPRNIVSPRFKERSENDDYMSDTPSIYNDEVQLRSTHLTNNKLTFQYF